MNIKDATPFMLVRRTHTSFTPKFLLRQKGTLMNTHPSAVLGEYIAVVHWHGDAMRDYVPLSHIEPAAVGATTSIPDTGLQSTVTGE